jgi:hypothetical protein
MRAWGRLSPGLRAVVVVAATSLLMVLVAWASLIGPDEVFTGPGPTPASLTTPVETCIPLPPSTGRGATTEAPDNPRNLPWCPPPDTSRRDATDIAERADPPLWLRVVVWTLEVVLLVAVLVLAGLGVRALARAVRRRVGARDERRVADFVELGEPERVAEQMAADAAEQDALLREGEPRNAIVAAWHRFEVQGERAGVGRRPAETTSEYAVRILDLVEADSGAVHRLAVLYREARFSEHQITEDHRATALEALAAIRRGAGMRA